MYENENSKKTKMLVVYTSFQIGGGAERFLLNFLEIFPSEKYQIDLVLFDYMQDEANMFDMIPKHINILPPMTQFQRWSPSLMDELRNTGKAEMAEIREFIRNRNKDINFLMKPLAERYDDNWNHLKEISPLFDGYDIAVAFMAQLPLKIVATRTACAKKLVFNHMDYKAIINTGHLSEEYLLSEQTYFDQMDGIVCVTEQNAATFLDYFPSLTDKIKVLTNVSNYNSICNLASAFFPPEYKESGFNILTIARIAPQKGIELLLHTAQILKAYGVNYRWFVLGNDAKDKYSLECNMQKESLGLNEDVLFLGAHSNPFPYYKNCDLYVQTSLYEGRPLSIEEAMMLNCSIVTTDFSSVRDQVEDGINGRICELDPNSLAYAIHELYNNPYERDKMAHANEQYTGDEGIEEYLKYFK